MGSLTVALIKSLGQQTPQAAKSEGESEAEADGGEDADEEGEDFFMSGEDLDERGEGGQWHALIDLLWPTPQQTCGTLSLLAAVADNHTMASSSGTL